MDKVILIKYGELSTKKGNRNFFINTLSNNVYNKLCKYDISIRKDRAHMYIEFKDSEFDSIKKDIDKVFGIHKYNIATIVPNDIDKIKDTVLDMVKSEFPSTFKIETKRSNKNFPNNSIEVNNIIGGYVLRNTDGIKVDVHNPEMLVKVEIRDESTYIYSKEYNGAGGYPVGTQPTGMLMLSGGIDSPVAGYLAMKRGVKLECVYLKLLNLLVS